MWSLLVINYFNVYQLSFFCTWKYIVLKSTFYPSLFLSRAGFVTKLRLHSRHGMYTCCLPRHRNKLVYIPEKAGKGEGVLWISFPVQPTLRLNITVPAVPRLGECGCKWSAGEMRQAVAATWQLSPSSAGWNLKGIFEFEFPHVTPRD